MAEWLPSWFPHHVVHGAIPRRDVRTQSTSEREVASRNGSLFVSTLKNQLKQNAATAADQ